MADAHLTLTVDVKVAKWLPLYLRILTWKARLTRRPIDWAKWERALERGVRVEIL
jgi:hypothetical protein